MEKKVILVVSGLLLLGSAALFAGEPVKKDNIFKQLIIKHLIKYNCKTSHVF